MPRKLHVEQRSKSFVSNGQDRLGLRARGKPVLRTPLKAKPAAVVPPAFDSMFEDFLPYLIVRLAYQLTNDLIVDLKAEGVNLVRWRILAVLAMADGSTVTEIGDRAMIQQSALSRMLMVMEAEKHLTRRLRREDGRCVEVFLTDQGRKLFDSLNVVVRRRQSRILKGLSASEIDAAFAFVKKMSANLRGRRTEGGSSPR
jgi:DNA-binding MarR family transcriptional regulator